MKTFLKIFNWLSLSSSDAVKNSIESCQTRQRHGNDTATTRQRVLTTGLSYRKIAILTLLLTLGVGQMWAGAGFYEAYFAYSYNGTTGSKTCTSSGTETTDLGTLTADFNITQLCLKYWKDGSGNMCGGLVEYYISSDEEYQPSWTWTAKGGNNHELNWSGTWTVAQYNSGASGAYTFWYRFKTWGSSSSSSGCSTNYYIPTDGSSKNKVTYKIAPPAVSSFAVSTTGSNILSGSGTSGDPYIIAYKGNLVLTLSGNKGRTDANSSLQYNTSGTWNSTTSRTISSITSTTKTSVTVKMRCYNSTASLSGTESTKTIYYKSEPSYSVTFADDGNGSVTAPASSPKTVGQNSGIVINASANSGYSFDRWTISSGSGSFTLAATTASNTFKPTAASTITATFKPDWALYNGSTLLGIFTKVSSTQYTLSVDLSRANHHQLQFKKDGATGYIVGADDPTSTFRDLSVSAGYFNWANIQNVVTGTYFITLKYESSTWKYKAEQKYTLTYDANGATSGTAPVDGSSPYLPNTAITTAGNSGSLAKSSFNFTGWNTRADGQGTHYNASTANAFNITANTTLYAEWTPNVPSSACLDGDFGSVTMNKSTSGSTTTFTYTFYDKAAGTYNFYLKDCSSSTALLKATNGVTMTQTGCTSIASTGASNYYFRVVTGAAGDITITATYNTSAKTINMDVTRVAIDAVTPSWWLIGDAALFTNWNTDNHSYPLNRSYRGMSDVFYRVVDFGGNTTAYFKPLKGNTRYGHNEGGGNKTVTTGTQYAIKATSSDGTAFKTNGQGVVWCVVDQTNNKFWEQNPTTYYTITLANGSSGNTGNGVAGTEGTVTLTTNNLGNLKTKQYESGERVNISVSAKSGYYVDDITIGATSVATDVNASSYSGYTTMPSGNTTLTVTYKPLYTVTFNVGTGMSTYGSVSNSLSISSGTKVLTGTSITFTATPNLGYKFVGWYSDASCTSSVSTDNPYTFSVTAATKLYAKFEYRNLYIHADFISNWATPAQMTQSTVNRAVYTYTVNNMAILASAQVGDAWNTGYHFHFVNTVANPNDNKAYNYNGVQTPTYSGSSIDGVHKTHTDNPTIEFGLTRKSNVTITLTLQSIDDATKPTVNIAADPIYSITHGDPTHGSYTIKVGSASAVGTSTESVAGTTITLAATPATGYHFDSWTVTKAGGGTVTVTSNQFTMPSNDVTVAATFLPNTYDVILNKNGATSGSNQTVTATFDAAMPTTLKGGGDIVAPSKTGYTFSGYTANSNGSGTQYYTAGLLSNHVWDVATNNTNIYAKWSANTYRVTFDVDEENHGTIAGATGYQDVTYDGSTTTVPNRPTAANGYAFMGYYTDQGGEGLKVINADGTWIASVSGYTDGSKKWKYAGDVTLYAYYKKAEIAAITFDNAVVESNGPVSFAVTVSPTPVGDTKLCFTVLHSNDNPLAEQPTVTYSAGKYSFKAPEASGTYKVEAVLRTGSSCDGGTELDTEEASFQVAGIHTVTVRYKCGDDVIKAATTVTGRPLDWSDAITAPEIFGYTFSGWTTGDGVTLTDDNGTTTKVSTTEATIRIKAIYDGSLIASYAQKKLIYFKNTLGWSDVYVNFHTANAWNNTGNGSGSPKGVGNSGLTNRNKHMIQIGETDVWYYDYGYNDGGSSITPSLYVSFTNKSRDGVSEFWAENPGIDVVYPANYPDAISTDKSSENGFKAATPMFVPLESQEAKPINVGGGGKANYYNAGYWTKYTPGTGYTLEIYNSAGNVLLKSVEFTSEDELMPMKAVVDLEAGQTYKYQLRRGGTDSYGIYYGNSGTMTYANHGSPTPWDMSNGSFSMCGITTNAAGDYTFNLSYSGHAAVNPHYRLRMAVDYPVALGDYRLLYKDKVHTAWHPSAVIPKANAKDTVSFFVRKGQSAQLKLQKCNGLTGEASWTDTISNWWSSLPSAITQDSVYNICLKHNASTGKLEIENVEPYTGNYYIRTDAANSKWDNYRSDPDHRMTYSEYSINHGGYSHYYCHWVQEGTSRKNVKFVIANDYSPCISDTLTRETASGTWANIETYIEPNGDLKRDANVRFMWNQHDNTIGRAYVDGAQEDGSRFLVISSTDGKIKQADGSALENNEVTFSDNENWIYEANVKAQPRSQFKLISTWGDGGAGGSDPVITQYFKGGVSSTETLIDGSGEAWYDIRLLYDFKTNRLVAAWVPSDANITSDNAINADVMFIREHQGDIAQVTFSEGGKISKIETAYGVIRFNKWTLANKEKTGGHSPLGSPASIYERSLFWISFPFRVKLSEVFGFGTYGTHWAIQRYDGAARAQKGHFLENGSFWRWMSRNTEYLEPNQGYLLAIDLDLLDENSDVWGPESRSEQIELYFPSYGTMPDITDADVAQTIPSHECTINWYEEGKVPGPDTKDPRTSYNRTIFDSHWNVLSVPTYVNTDDVSFANTTWTAKKPSFLYTWNADDNTITATSASGYTYHAMHAYMAQYAGGITWTASSGSPASIVARKTYAEQPKEVEFRLELQQNEKEIDRTFVVLSNDEEVSADFQFGEDLTKEFNASKASIYTFIPNVATVAGNTLPMSNQTTTVPVGVDVKANGDYTFAMPAGTSGIGVTLIDNETGVRTNLGLMDYTVTLTAGTYDQRFVLEIPAIQQTPTGVEEVTGDGLPVTGARKVLIDNKLYIIKGDKVYDARGAKVQ